MFRWLNWLSFPSCHAMAVLAMLGLMVGCGPNRPEMAPVSGTVLYEGKPLEGATVKFMPEGEGRPATGTTDAEGRFTLTTFEKGDGAVVGDHVVTVSKYAKPTVQPIKSDENGVRFRSLAEEQAYYNPPSLLPERYGNEVQSPLRATVQSGETNDITLELK